MGWFENQIEERRRADQERLEDAYVRIAGVILGESSAFQIHDAGIITKEAIDEILKYCHCKPVEVPPEISGTEEHLDYCLRPHGIMKREVELTEGWYQDAYGPILAFTAKDQVPTALLPGHLGGYYFHDVSSGKRVRLTKETAALFDKRAYCFYTPLPQRAIGIPDLLLYLKRCITISDLGWIIAATLAMTLVGLLMPRITLALTGPVLASKQPSALIGMAVCIVCISISSQLISSTRTLLMSRLETKTSLGVQASMMMRLISLPASFFRQYSAGELKSRSMSVNQLCSLLLGMVMTAGLTSISSLLYVAQIFQFAPVLVVPSLLIILVTIGFSVLTTLVQIRINKKQMELSAKESGMSYAMITGIQKVRLAGAEKRIFSRWLNLYAEGSELLYNPPMFIKINGVISTAISLFSNIFLYYLAVQSGLSPSSYFAFMAAYGAVFGAFSSLSGTALQAAKIRPILEMAEPFLKAVPEAADGKEIVTSIKGAIEMEH
ncbi:MAG: NHLP family bacteriocin export ABC transporter permease/ATPase subunit, partial [Lachnospiraceae bacterium]|nr:NHLP family bacteriocin export ABC transporter permease/ATPase subunit [Lachnospiraceae bacterium]